MSSFPAFLTLRQRPVLVVGGGENAARKVRLLRDAEAVLTVLAPALNAELAGPCRSRGDPAPRRNLLAGGAGRLPDRYQCRSQYR